MQSVAIIIGCITAAICYGIFHDLVTAHLCVEYFTVAHPPVQIGDRALSTPTTLALAWGVLATWWAGLALGVLLALAARAGRKAGVNAKCLIRPIAVLMLVTAVSAAISGAIGYSLAVQGAIKLAGSFAHRIPRDHHTRYYADAFAHAASYATGFLGGLFVIVMTYRKRAAVQR